MATEYDKLKALLNDKTLDEYAKQVDVFPEFSKSVRLIERMKHIESEINVELNKLSRTLEPHLIAKIKTDIANIRGNQVSGTARKRLQQCRELLP